MVAEEEVERMVVVVGVVDSIDGPYEAWECVIFWFLVKFTDEKKVVLWFSEKSGNQRKLKKKPFSSLFFFSSPYPSSLL